MMNTNPLILSCSSTERDAIPRLAELADEIVATHHAYVRRTLPRLKHLAEEAVRRDGAKHHFIVELPARLRELEDELIFHLLKEEQMLFPRIKRMERMGTATPASKPLKGLIERLEREHRNGNDALTKMRRLTGGFVAPSGTSEAYGLLLKSLADFDCDMQQHVYKEDAILFPRALELEARIHP